MPVIETNQLTKSFGTQRGIIEVDLSVDRGEIFGFLGPNGAGKSTTIRILMGLYQATSGTARIFGELPERDAADIHKRTGYLPGDLELFQQLTGRELLERVAHIRGLKQFEYRNELIERFGADLDRSIHTLSKGNRQKIGIVLAFMHKPDLLVLDEPTSGLDPLLQEEFVALLRETAENGRTVFLSSHDLDEVQRVVDRLAIIKDGRIVTIDSVEGLRSHAPRLIEVTFDHDINREALTGIQCLNMLDETPQRFRFTFTGPVAPVLQRVTPLQPVDLLARPADLEELFLDYYRSDNLERMSYAH